MFRLTRTHLGVLLVNHLQIRKEKWYRASTVFILTSRKDRNCDICLRTKITRASCRRRTGTVVPRAEKFCDLVTADHKVHNEGCESRNNHRYAVVVQDLATQWLQSYPCETKTSQKLKRACKSSWSRRGNQKSSVLTIPSNLASLVRNVRNFPGINVRQHHTDQKQMGLQKEQCAQ